ncbi:hypothetical protein CASFOL_019309 [Castilleja foliolosa]|uniref:Zinc finger LSD1-type domain-containing protein n=1 Tax=Castilleja foliolosa TaxID=1961234 RepID=A0ABD3D406_9LAMI
MCSVRGMQSQIVCSGCRSLLMYPSGASNVCCALCNTITNVPPPDFSPTSPRLQCSSTYVLNWLRHVQCEEIVDLAEPTHFVYTLDMRMEMAQLICGCCRTLLMYTRGATSVRCSCCHTVNLAPAPNVSHINCGNCHTTLMYPYGAPSVKCAVCQHITNVNMGNVRVPIPMHRPAGPPSAASPPSSSASQTVVVENPMSVDKSGKLVSNVVVGVTTDKK